MAKLFWALLLLGALTRAQDLSIQALTDSNDKVPVYTDGKLSPGFDPTIPSQTCKPAPTQMKVFRADPTKSNPDKTLFLDFAFSGVNQEYRFSVLGKEDPMNPQIYPRTLKVSKDKEQRVSVDYKC